MKLNKKYGLWTVLATTLTATIGSSIIITFGNTLFMSGENAILMILAWIFGAIIVLPEAFLMIEPSISYQKSGTGYSWLKICNWKLMAFWFGWILVLFVSATSLASCCTAMASLFRQLVGMEANTIWEKIIGIGILFLIGGSQIFIKNSSKVTQFIFLVAKILPILLIIILTFIYGSKDGILTNPEVNKDFTKLYLSTIMLIPAAALTGFAYSGTETATYITEEIDNPKKTVPKTVVGGIIIVMLIYIIYTIALLSIAKPGELIGGNGEETIVSKLSALPNWAKITFNVFAIILMIGSINALVLFQSRLVFKLAEERDIPGLFTKTHKRTNQPYLAMLLLMAFASLYVFSHTLTQIVSSFIFATILLKTLLNLSIINLRKNDPEYKKIYSKSMFLFLVIASFVTILITLLGILYMMFIQPIMSMEEITFVKLWAIIWQPLLMLFVVIILLPIGYYKNKLQEKSSKNINIK